MDEFYLYRAEMNEKLVGCGHLGIKRFFALDTQAYEDGALDKKTKELMGLTASIVLRCDDWLLITSSSARIAASPANNSWTPSTSRGWWAARSRSRICEGRLRDLIRFCRVEMCE